MPLLVILAWILTGYIFLQITSLIVRKKIEKERDPIVLSFALGPLMLAAIVVSVVTGDYF